MGAFRLITRKLTNSQNGILAQDFKNLKTGYKLKIRKFNDRLEVKQNNTISLRIEHTKKK